MTEDQLKEIRTEAKESLMELVKHTEEFEEYQNGAKPRYKIPENGDVFTHIETFVKEGSGQPTVVSKFRYLIDGARFIVERDLHNQQEYYYQEVI